MEQISLEQYVIGINYHKMTNVHLFERLLIDDKAIVTLMFYCGKTIKEHHSRLFNNRIRKSLVVKQDYLSNNIMFPNISPLVH